jgi:hypothetical protein
MDQRVVATGALMIALAGGFFLYTMIGLAPRSNDPVEIMQTVGEVSGAVGAIGLAMVMYGALRRRR